MNSKIKKALVTICEEAIKVIGQEDRKKVIVYSPDVTTRRYLGNLFLNHKYRSENDLAVEDVEFYNPLKNLNSNGEVYSVDLAFCLAEKGISGNEVFKNAKSP